MNLTQLFKPIRQIVGVEIAHGRIVAVLLEKDKAGILRGTKKEAAIPGGIIAPDGTVADKQKLASALKAFWQSGKGGTLGSKFVICSIPSASLFSDVISFPKIPPEQIEESVKLNLASKALFPIDANAVYYDWQSTLTHDAYRQQVLISFAPKTHIQAYVEACETAGLEPLAFEPVHFSLARTIVNFAEKPGLIISISAKNIALVIAKGNDILFTRLAPLPASYDLAALGTAVKTEAFKALNYYATENPHHEPVTAAVVFSRVPQKNEIITAIEKELGIPLQQPRFAENIRIDDASVPAFGAALRGLIPREEDTINSVMPIGTEEAYRKRRFLAYVSLWADIINTTAVIFVALFAATLVFLNFVEKSAAAQTTRLKAAAAQSERTAEMEKEAIRFNAIAGAVAQANETITPLSPTIEKILPTLRHDGITLKTIAIDPSGTSFRVSAVAATRDAAVAFRKSLENNPLYAKASVPALSASQRTNISLDITLTLKP